MLATTHTTPIEIFFSYSHRDERMRSRLEAHLSSLKRERLILGWHDRKIKPGTEWKGQIDSHLDSSRIILLLISADFLASDYCYDVEMDRAMARHDAGEARVIPIILRPCDWPWSRFGKLQALPRDGKPVSDWSTHDQAFNEVARGIRRVVEELAKASESAAPSLLKSETILNPVTATGDNVVTEQIQIPVRIKEKLQRMRMLNAIFKTDEDAEEDLFAEYRDMLEEMVEVFLPLVNLLVKGWAFDSEFEH
ncbi:toll/interleukin-1 receptor domain-containing protein [Geomonas ferrireducens]|uniref:toll/interleukin-1 receptor domain-containing protein n=1 Tax=Geomonas ferrireducens TaxID=2570227 RepID=UPI0010A80252|nr:toll/interleukin-1 receptor domain-containing protein [Geomonas ferrireducens]